MYLNLKLSIWQAGLRQNRLAQALKMDEALLSKIINGFRQPTAEQRRLIANLLQKDEQWLFVRNDHPAVPPSNGGDLERDSR